MTCTANRVRQWLELLFRISSASSQFTQEHANQLFPKHNDRVPQSPPPGAPRARMDLPQQPRSREHSCSADPWKKGNGLAARTLPSMDSIRPATPTRLHFLF